MSTYAYIVMSSYVCACVSIRIYVCVYLQYWHRLQACEAPNNYMSIITKMRNLSFLTLVTVTRILMLPPPWLWLVTVTRILMLPPPCLWFYMYVCMCECMYRYRSFIFGHLIYFAIPLFTWCNFIICTRWDFLLYILNFIACTDQYWPQ